MAHIQFLPTSAVVVSEEEVVAHLHSAVMGHIDLQSFEEEEEEEVHPFEADHIDLQQVVVVAVVEAAVPS